MPNVPSAYGYHRYESDPRQTRRHDASIHFFTLPLVLVRHSSGCGTKPTL